MKSIWKKYNLWISAVTFLIVVLAVSFFVLAPIRRNIEFNADEIQKKIIDNEIYEERVQKIPEMEKTQEVFEANRNNLKVFLGGSSEVDFIKKIETVAEETGNRIMLTVEDSAAQAKRAVPKKGEVDIRSTLPGNNKYVTIYMSLQGSYENAFEFLHKLENINYYVNVISLDLTKDMVMESADNPFVTATQKQEGSMGKEVVKSNFEAIVYLEAE